MTEDATVPSGLGDQRRDMMKAPDEVSAMLRLKGLGRGSKRIAALQPRGNGTAVWSRSCRRSVRDNGHEQRCACRDRVDYRGCLSMDPIEASLPAALPLAIDVPARSMASRRVGSRHERYAAWSLLPRLLLDADGPAVRWRIDEPIVGWRTCPTRADREDPPLGRPHEPRDRCCTGCVGHCRACKHVTHGRVQSCQGQSLRPKAGDRPS
jgi:hypothetical protein